MLRLTAEGVALFLTPFAIYVALLLLATRWPRLRQAGLDGRGMVVAVCGAGLVVLGLLALGILGERDHGAYVPAHVENGQLVPGRIQ